MDKLKIQEERERIRMELYKEVYLKWVMEIPKWTGNVAEGKANQALKCFDANFPAIGDE